VFLSSGGKDICNVPSSPTWVLKLIVFMVSAQATTIL
jgi:hypothetical protein